VPDIILLIFTSLLIFFSEESLINMGIKISSLALGRQRTSSDSEVKAFTNKLNEVVIEQK
jgi:hypothetical protein